MSYRHESGVSRDYCRIHSRHHDYLGMSKFWDEGVGDFCFLVWRLRVSGLGFGL